MYVKLALSVNGCVILDTEVNSCNMFLCFKQLVFCSLLDIVCLICSFVVNTVSHIPNQAFRMSAYHNNSNN